MCDPQFVRPSKRDEIGRIRRVIDGGATLFGKDFPSAKRLMRRLKRVDKLFRNGSGETKRFCRTNVGRFKLTVMDEYLRLIAETVRGPAGSDDEGKHLHCITARILADGALEAGATEAEVELALGACVDFRRDEGELRPESADAVAKQKKALETKRGRTPSSSDVAGKHEKPHPTPKPRPTPPPKPKKQKAGSQDVYSYEKDGHIWFGKTCPKEATNCKLILKKKPR